MNALHLTLGYYEPNSGVTKKIYAQADSIKRTGFNKTFIGMYNEDMVLCIDNLPLYRCQSISNLKGQSQFFNTIEKFIDDNGVKFVYYRFNTRSEPSIIRFFHRLKKKDIVSVMEIPTYPYVGELKKDRFYYLDKFTHNLLGKQFKRIVTFSDDKKIFGQKTTNISNGVDFNKLPLRTPRSSEEFNILGVANYRYWHGFDRILHGLKNYIDRRNEPVCRFHIVSGKDNDDVLELKQLAKDLGIEAYVVFHGQVSGKGLDELFNKSQLAIGSLARHRNKITYLKTLKNVEYAARGIPFVYSEINEDFESMPYVIKASQDDSPIDIETLMADATSIKLNPEEIRNTVLSLSWDEQMKKIISECFE